MYVVNSIVSRPSEHISLSVIITCFNYQQYIDDAILSVLQQIDVDRDAVEVIVVDDGSTDGSWNLIEKYTHSDAMRVTAIRQRNVGPLRSSLAGFSHASGRYVYFLDADDYVDRTLLAEVFPLLEENPSKIQFMVTPVDKGGQPLNAPFPALSADQTTNDLIQSIEDRGYYATPPTSGNIYRRDVYQIVENEIDEMGYERAIDGVAYLIAPFLGPVISVDKPLGYYRVHETNLSGFGSRSGARAYAYADRFSGRLRHLDALLRKLPISGRVPALKTDYAYAFEMRLIGRVLDGGRLTIKEAYRYGQLIIEEFKGLRRVCFVTFGVLLLVLPNGISKRLVDLRLNPVRLAFLRRFMKRIAS